MRIDDRLSGRILDSILKKGASHGEVFQTSSRRISADVRLGETDAIETSRSFGYCLRLINNGKLGFSYSTDPSEASVVVETALEMSKLTEHDEYLDFPTPAAITGPVVYDDKIASISEEDAIKKALTVEKSALGSDTRIKKTRKASAFFSVHEVSIANTKGLSYRYELTSSGASIMSVAEDGPDSQMGWGYQSGRFLQDIDFNNVGVESSKRALMLLGAKRISASKSNVLLDSLVATEFLSIFATMLSSEAVQKGKSLLKGKRGMNVISDFVDIIDDGLMERAPGSRHMDDEGVPAKRKELIQKGTLVEYMYNTRTAKKEGLDSAGNAVKGGISAIPSVGPLNLYLTTSENRESFESLVGKVKRGLYVIDAMGMHTVNPVSGDFSIGVSGLWIENGQLQFPVKELVISGNILDLFSNVEAVGNDLRFYGNIGSPSLLFGPTDISA